MKNEKAKKALFIAAIYLIWAILTVGAIFLMFSGRTAILAVLARYSAQGFNQRMLVGTLDKLYMIGAGIVILSFTIAAERYLSNSKSRKALAARSLLCLGIEFSTLVLSTLMIQLASRTFLGSMVLMITLLVPIIAAAAAFTGSGLIRRSIKNDRQPKPSRRA